MDWLPRPSEVVNPLPEVPCLSPDHAYDHHHGPGEWEGYPERQGYGSRSVLHWMQLFQWPTTQLMPFIERWLFWAPLEAMLLGQAFLPSNFTQPHADGHHTMRLKTLSERLLVNRRSLIDRHQKATELLKAFLTPCSVNLVRLAQDCSGCEVCCPTHTTSDLDSSNDAESLRNCSCKDEDNCMQVYLLRNSECSMYHFCLNFPDNYPDPRSVELSSATAILFDVVAASSILTMGKIEKYIQKRRLISAASEHHFDKTLAGAALLRRAGWCPRRARNVALKHSTTFCVYLSQMRCPYDEEEHNNCTSELCLRHNVDNQVYHTRHVEGCGGCVSLVVDHVQLSAILRSRCVPLLESNALYKGGKLRLVPHIRKAHANTNNRYAAFSHVWSQGMGNLDDNALPYCQIQRLQKNVNSLQYKDITGKTRTLEYWWLDTLCVPPDKVARSNPIQARLQLFATHKLRESYAWAEVTVVLDSWLSRNMRVEASPLEKLAMIACSPWTSRLWTLQEGLLTRSDRLMFVHDGDRPLNADSPFRKQFGAVWARERCCVIADTISGYLEVRHIFASGPIRTAEPYRKNQPNHPMALLNARPHTLQLFFSSIINALNVRSTSVASDEVLCLAVLFGLNVENVINSQHQERITHVWSRLRVIPLTVLLLDAPR